MDMLFFDSQQTPTKDGGFSGSGVCLHCVITQSIWQALNLAAK